MSATPSDVDVDNAEDTPVRSSGVHVGGNPAARAMSFERLESFLRAQWKLSA